MNISNKMIKRRSTNNLYNNFYKIPNNSILNKISKKYFQIKVKIKINKFLHLKIKMNNNK